MGKKEKKEKEVTYSSKTDKHAEHKHLFGSSGNSDFIINMTPEGARKLAGVYSMIAMILLAMSSLPYYLSKQFGEANDMMLLQTDSNTTLSFLIMTIAVIMGFMGMMVFMIQCVKKEVVLARNKGLAIFVMILLAAVVSMIGAQDPMTALFGYLDRAEGVLTLIGYIGFFTVGMCLTSGKWRSAASGTIVGIGTANAVIGILQSIPALSEYIPSYYNYLFKGYRIAMSVNHTAVTRAEYFNSYAGYDASFAADGVTCSPFALAALMTVAAAFAVNRAAYAEKTSQRVVNLICTGLMIGAAVVTQTLPALIGIGCVLVVTLITALTDRVRAEADGDDEEDSGRGSVNKGAIVTSLLSIVTCGAIVAGVVLTDNFRLRDEEIIFTDSFERLSVAYDSHTDHTGGIYQTLWYDGWLVFKEHPVIGVGSDNWITMYGDGEGMETDRTYNEYLDIALTRGSVGLLLYCVMILFTLGKAVRMLKAAHLGDSVSKQAAYGAFAAFTAYLIQAFFNITWMTSTPFFMLAAGMIWSFEAVTGKPAAKKDNE